MRHSRGLSVLVAIATFAILTPAGVSGTHDGYHRYSQADEITGASYTGARVVRIDRAVTHRRACSQHRSTPMPSRTGRPAGDLGLPMRHSRAGGKAS